MSSVSGTIGESSSEVWTVDLRLWASGGVVPSRAGDTVLPWAARGTVGSGPVRGQAQSPPPPECGLAPSQVPHPGDGGASPPPPRCGARPRPDLPAHPRRMVPCHCPRLSPNASSDSPDAGHVGAAQLPSPPANSRRDLEHAGVASTPRPPGVRRVPTEQGSAPAPRVSPPGQRKAQKTEGECDLTPGLV